MNARTVALMRAARHPLIRAVPTVRGATGLGWEVAHRRGLVAPAGAAARSA